MQGSNFSPNNSNIFRSFDPPEVKNVFDPKLVKINTVDLDLLPQSKIWSGRIVQMPFSIARGIYDFVMKIFQIIGDYWNGKKNGINEGEKEPLAPRASQSVVENDEGEKEAPVPKKEAMRKYVEGVDVDSVPGNTIVRKKHSPEFEALKVSEQIAYYLEHEEALDSLHQFLPPAPEVSNTKLGDILVHQAFSIDTYMENKAASNRLLTLLVNRAAEGDIDAYRALTYPNDLGNEIPKEKIDNGFPRNTPLALLVKTGNLEGVKIILKAYKSEDLLTTTYAGNTVFHLAVGTGQIEMAKAILERARELGIEQEMLEVRNRMDLTAKEIYTTIMNPQYHKFGVLGDVSGLYFGGEEISKAIISFCKNDTGDTADQPMHSLRRKVLLEMGLRGKTFEEVMNITT